MENWCWERESLDLFARHCETGEAIPEDLFQKMKRAKTFRAANAQMRQLGFGFVDLALHREWDGPDRRGRVFARRCCRSSRRRRCPTDYAMIAGFTHLFASPVAYGAGYYSYKWAEVLDADAFTRFRKEGVFSPSSRARLPREDSGARRQRGSGGAVPHLHGARSGSGCAARTGGASDGGAIGKSAADARRSTPIRNRFVIGVNRRLSAAQGRIGEDEQ